LAGDVVVCLDGQLLLLLDEVGVLAASSVSGLRLARGVVAGERSVLVLSSIRSSRLCCFLLVSLVFDGLELDSLVLQIFSGLGQPLVDLVEVEVGVLARLGGTGLLQVDLPLLTLRH